MSDGVAVLLFTLALIALFELLLAARRRRLARTTRRVGLTPLRVTRWLVRARLWSIYVHMRQPQIRARWGTRWLLDWLLDWQTVDNLHHAPACPANHYHRARLVTGRCTCGAREPMYEGASRRRGALPRCFARRLEAAGR